MRCELLGAPHVKKRKMVRKVIKTVIKAILMTIAISNAINGGCSSDEMVNECDYSRIENHNWPTSNMYTDISCSDEYCCALNESGMLDCWGDDFGSCKNCPSSETKIRKISAGINHICVLRENGIVECWGCEDEDRSIDYGQCNVFNDTDIKDISTGIDFTCGLHQDGTIECLGQDYEADGECQPPLGKDYTEISGECGLHKDGSIECWCEPPPEAWIGPPSDKDFTAISGECGLHRDGSIECWKWNKEGERKLPSEKGFVAVSDNGGYTCGLHEEGSIKCWGIDDFGPTSDKDFIAVSQGWNYICGLHKDGSIECWGKNPDCRSPVYTITSP